jgi:hypothetical protein
MAIDKILINLLYFCANKGHNMPRKTDTELLLDISNKLTELTAYTRLQNEILCRVHQTKLPKNLIRRAAPDLLAEI